MVKWFPRTAAAAEKHGFKKVKVNFAKLSYAERTKYIYIDATGAKSNAIALIRPADALPPEQVTPSVEPGTYIVGYYDPQTRRYDLNCYAVSAAELEVIKPHAYLSTLPGRPGTRSGGFKKLTIVRPEIPSGTKKRSMALPGKPGTRSGGPRKKI